MGPSRTINKSSGAHFVLTYLVTLLVNERKDGLERRTYL
jgi:hypothetical protein